MPHLVVGGHIYGVRRQCPIVGRGTWADDVMKYREATMGKVGRGGLGEQGGHGGYRVHCIQDGQGSQG